MPSELDQRFIMKCYTKEQYATELPVPVPEYPVPKVATPRRIIRYWTTEAGSYTIGSEGIRGGSTY